MTSQDEIIILHIAYKRRGYLELTCCFRKGRWIAHHIDVEQVPCFKAGQHVGKATCGLLITWMLKRYLVGKGTCELHHIDVEKVPCFKVGQHVGKGTCGLLITGSSQEVPC